MDEQKTKLKMKEKKKKKKKRYLLIGIANFLGIILFVDDRTTEPIMAMIKQSNSLL